MGTIRWKRPGAALITIALAMAMLIATAGTASARDNRARTTTTLVASPTSSSAGQPVTLTATVAFSGTWRSPGGRVYFGATNGTRQGTVFLGSAGLTNCSAATKTCKAVLTTSNLPVGNDLVGAAYSGDNRYQPSAGATRVNVSAAYPSSSTTCAADQPCTSPVLVSRDGTTTLQVFADPSSAQQTVNAQLGGFPAMSCTTDPTRDIIADYHTTAGDVEKRAEYTLTGADAVAAFYFWVNTGLAGCYAQEDPWDGYTFAGEGYSFGPAVTGPSGFYEAYLPPCDSGEVTILASGFTNLPCSTFDTDGFCSEGCVDPTYFTIIAYSPPSPNDPRLGY